uniref:Polymerase PB2 n=1 Tax=Usinis virus TaxID=2800948 RepID=A0A894KPR4_9VIRU|nr:MAG: polymerase PB2 [Usinis virus]QRW42649.1 MAG: polymerase PB2 [Usinis virus]QRW42653.1 MAG: polymerase PB2 [Usinis virus]
MNKETLRDEAQKKRLLAVCRKIINLPPGSHEILQKAPICNLRQIERQAKNVKDPSPLQTMMASISEKYPISGDMEKLKACGIPQDMIGQKDMHRVGRVMVKKEAIDFFINTSSAPDENVKKAIEIIYDNQNRMADEYFKWDWSTARVSFGQQEMQRRVVRTNSVVMEVPRGERTQLLIAAFFPENVIHWDMVDKGLLKKLLTTLGDISVARLPLLHQTRLLASAMDPRERMLPTSPSLPMDVQYFRHSFSSNDHITKVVTKNPQSFTSGEEYGEMLGRVIAWRSSKNDSQDEIRKQLEGGTIDGLNITNIVRMTKEPGIYKDVVRAVFGLQSPAVVTIRGVDFYPQGGKITSMTCYNQAGRLFHAYRGKETVLLNHQGAPCSFTRMDGGIATIKMLVGTGRNLKEILARIAIFLRIGWFKSTKPTVATMAAESYDWAKREPWAVLSEATGGYVSKAMYQRAVNSSTNFSCVEFLTEAPAISPRSLRVKLSWPFLTFENGMQIKVMPPLLYPVLPLQTILRGTLLSDHYSPIARLKVKIGFFSHPKNFEIMEKLASEGDFEWQNEGIRMGVQGNRKDQIHATARALYQKISNDPQTRDRRLLVLLYCFASKTPTIVPATHYCTEFQWCGSIDINLKGLSGAVTITNKGILVNGDVVVKIESRVSDGVMAQFVPGWEIIAKPKTLVPVSPFRVLSDTQHKEGKIMAVGAYGKIFYLRKSALAKEKYNDTIKRQILAFQTAEARIAQKRLLDQGIVFQLEEGTTQGVVKRIRLEDSDSDDAFD